jgi:hypothetical protein
VPQLHHFTFVFLKLKSNLLVKRVFFFLLHAEFDYMDMKIILSMIQIVWKLAFFPEGGGTCKWCIWKQIFFGESIVSLTNFDMKITAALSSSSEIPLL